MLDHEAPDPEVRAIAADLVAWGYKVTLDYSVTSDVAALLIQRQRKTLRNMRYNLCGPPWQKMADGSVWYRIDDLVRWMREQGIELPSGRARPCTQRSTRRPCGL